MYRPHSASNGFRAPPDSLSVCYVPYQTPFSSEDIIMLTHSRTPCLSQELYRHKIPSVENHVVAHSTVSSANRTKTNVDGRIQTT